MTTNRFKIFELCVRCRRPIPVMEATKDKEGRYVCQECRQGRQKGLKVGRSPLKA